MQILAQYERLCHKLARKFAFVANNQDHNDLVQEGRIGLLNAIETYDPKYGAKFFTWAYYQVRAHIVGSGRSDRKQPKYPHSIEDCPRAYNVEDPSQEVVVKDDIPHQVIIDIIEQCCGGFNSKRANIVMDRFGLFGRKQLRNSECAEKYGLTKYAVNSHTYAMKKHVREKFPHLGDFV